MSRTTTRLQRAHDEQRCLEEEINRLQEALESTVTHQHSDDEIESQPNEAISVDNSLVLEMLKTMQHTVSALATQQAAQLSA